MSAAAFTCHFLDAAAHTAAEAARMALGTARGKDQAWLKANNTDYGWATLGEVVKPCPMWFATWHFDPADPEHKIRRDAALAAIADGTFGKGERNYYLSKFYWQQWSHLRPPISVLCPNGAEWCVDAKSSNGDGWTVTGAPPKITCSPSILVPGYHGFLRDGVFTANIG
jgi:hypothetical protein